MSPSYFCPCVRASVRLVSSSKPWATPLQLNVTSSFAELRFFQMDELNYEVWKNFFACFDCVTVMFVYCVFGTLVTSNCADVATHAFATPWYKYPPELRPFFILILARANQPFFFTGMRMLPVSLLSFTKVCESIDLFELHISIFDNIPRSISADETDIFVFHSSSNCFQVIDVPSLTPLSSTFASNQHSWGGSYLLMFGPNEL